MDSFSLFNVFHLLEFFTVTVDLRELSRPSSHTGIQTNTHIRLPFSLSPVLPCLLFENRFTKSLMGMSLLSVFVQCKEKQTCGF